MMRLGSYLDLEHKVVEYEDGTYFVSKIIEGFPATLTLRKIIPCTDYEYLKGVSPDDVSQTHLDVDDFYKMIGAMLSVIYQEKSGVMGPPSLKCKTDFKPFQFRPLLKYYKSGLERVLIADGVGLGKTIEAGYILVEEMVRSGLEKVLILSPSHLKHKWRSELWNRFGLGFDLIESGLMLKKCLEERDRYLGIASIDCSRNIKTDFTDLYLDGKKIDMLIIDEIHHMIGRSGHTHRRQLGLSLSIMAKRCVGITAAPIQIEIDDLKRVFDIVYPGLLTDEEFVKEMEYNSLLNEVYWILSKKTLQTKDKDVILKKIEEAKGNYKTYSTFKKADKEELDEKLSKVKDTIICDRMDDISRMELRKSIHDLNTFSSLYTMSRAIEVGEARYRDIQNLTIELDDEIIEAHQSTGLVRTSEKKLYEEVDSLLSRSFSEIHRFQLSSSLPAMLGLIRNGMSGFSVWNPDKNIFDYKKNILCESVIEECKGLADKFGLIKKDTKWESLVKKLESMKDDDHKTLVFTQWIPTLDNLDRKRIELPYKTFLISSGDDNYTRMKKAKAFQEYDGFAVLFSTDILSEGIDLQSASAVINYDLPTTPQTIEQRIGRVDRVGQERKYIKIVNMIVEGSKDEEWLPKIKERIDIQRKGIGIATRILEDEKEVIQEYDEYIFEKLREMDIEELKEDIILWGIDDILDVVIKNRHEELKMGDTDLRWTCIRNMLKAISGDEGMDIEVLGGKKGVTIKNVKDLDMTLIRDILDKKHEIEVMSELYRFKMGEEISLDLGSGGREGMHIPYLHPLFTRSIEISNNAFFEDILADDDLDKRVFKITPTTITYPYDKDYLILVEAEVGFMDYLEKEMLWLSVNKKIGTDICIHRVEDFSLEKMYRDYEKGNMIIDFDNNGPAFDFTHVKAQIEVCLEDILEDLFAKIKRMLQLKKEREYRYLNWRIDKLDKIQESKNIKKVYMGVASLNKRLDAIETELNLLKSGKIKHNKNIKILFIFKTTDEVEIKNVKERDMS